METLVSYLYSELFDIMLTEVWEEVLEALRVILIPPPKSKKFPTDRQRAFIPPTVKV